MIKVYVYHDGKTRTTDRIEPESLDPASGTTLWVDLVQPTPEEGRQVLADTFHFHPLSIEDALSEVHHPKIEPYDRYLYIILHGIDFRPGEHDFAAFCRQREGATTIRDLQRLDWSRDGYRIRILEDGTLQSRRIADTTNAVEPSHG